MRHRGVLFALLLLSWALPRLGAAEAFIAGADFSHLALFESRGIIYRDGGQARDALAILKGRGLTCVRLRLFTSTAEQAAADPYNYINNLDYTVPLAVRVQNAGLRFLLDLHYSDTWADPGHQSKPAAWTNLSFVGLAAELRRYNSNCIAAFKAAGAMPDYVQVGNEITAGMLWPDGRVGGAYDTPAQWSRLGQLITNAIAGIREGAAPEVPGIMVHIDRGGDWEGAQWFFDHLVQQSVRFDIIGLSYYPFWHGSLGNLANCLTNAAKKYSRPIMVAETAFPWTGSPDVYGIPASPAGQVQYVCSLAQTVRLAPAGKVTGIFWWGTEYQASPGLNLAGFDQRSFFDSSGSTLPVADAFGQLAAPLALRASLSGTNLTLNWPVSGIGSTLRTATNLAPPVVWETLSNSVQSTGALFRVTPKGQTSPIRLFQLQSN